ncbi:siderophore-iron reductase FhuF [Azorhizobium caulinodans]|uniref:siderophore-iron reductase FhuF n=1 Tax=Azorhizobium caulinodans TaxID=7 RepID=UPI002FBDA6EF
MIPELAPLFTGELAPYAHALRLEPTDGVEAGASLLASHSLETRLAAFSRRWAEPDRRAVASVWVKHHFSNVLTPVIAANLLLGRDLPVNLAEVGILTSDDGTTAALILPHLGGRAEAGTGRFLSLIEGHLRPLIGAVAQHVRIAPKVLWSNFGNQFEALIRQASDMGMPAAADGEALMAARRLPDGAPNPLFAPIRYEEGRRLRRVCCLRYLIPELDYCDTCPLEEARGP